MENTNLRDKLRNILGDAPVASVMPSCGSILPPVSSGNELNTLPQMQSYVPMPPGQSISFQPEIYTVTPSQSNHITPPQFSNSPEKTNLFSDYKFVILVAISIICITIVLCMMIPQKEDRDMQLSQPDEDDGYIEKPQRRRPVIPDDTLDTEDESDHIESDHIESGHQRLPDGRQDRPQLRQVDQMNIDRGESSSARRDISTNESRSGGRMPTDSGRKPPEEDPMFQRI